MKILITFIIGLLLAGCVTKKEYVYLTEKQVVDIPVSYFEKPSVPAPPLKEDYIKLSSQQKEKTLSQLIVKLYKTIADFSDSLDFIKQYNQEQKIIIESENEKIKALDKKK